MPGVLRYILSFLLLVLTCSASAEDRMRVVFISPGAAESGFWGPTIRFAEAVAEDLNIDLEVVVSPPDSRLTRHDVLNTISRMKPKDYLLSGYWLPATQDLIPAASAREVNVFVIVNRLPYFDRERYGKPQQIYKNWIGHSYIDAYQEGLNLAEIITNEALRLGLLDKSTGVINVGSLVAGNEEVGLRNDSEHVRALRNFTDRRKDIALNGVYYAYWNREVAKSIIPVKLRRHKNLHAIWSQNHSMALGAIEGLVAAGMEPGKDVIVGAYNWAPESLNAVRDEKLYVALGGHFISAGIALIMMHDHYHGVDFQKDTGAEFIVPLVAITKKNVDRYIRVLNSRYWHAIDFRRFSKKYNPELKQYNFSPDHILGIQ